MYRQPNAERVVILVNITRLATFLLNPVLTAVHLIIHAINVHHANPLRPAITQLMSAALTDVRLTVLAALLAKLANHLLLAAVAVPVAVPAAVAHAINTNLVQQNAPALPTPKPIAKQTMPRNIMSFVILKLPEIGSTAPDNQKPAAGRLTIAEEHTQLKLLARLLQLKRPVAVVLTPGHIAAQKKKNIAATLFNYLPNTKKALCISTKSFS